MSATHTSTHTLLLRLAGPMQSWGYRSRFDNRDTALEPTKSGVIGLLCAAFGQTRDKADVHDFAALRMGVRVENPGRVMVDYQTADSVQMQSWRYYLSDARFLVGLEGHDLDFLHKVECRLRNPIFPLFLGRKSYVPSLPVALPDSGIREGIEVETALRAERWRRTYRGESVPELRLVVELGADDDPLEGRATPDVPRNLATRSFAPRYVKSVTPVIEFNKQEDELWSTSRR